MHDYYKPYTLGLPWTTFLDLIGWEFFFRGWILFGYARKFGPEALWLHAVPFALAHIGKPEVETLSTIFGGFAFGGQSGLDCKRGSQGHSPEFGHRFHRQTLVEVEGPNIGYNGRRVNDS